MFCVSLLHNELFFFFNVVFQIRLSQKSYKIFFKYLTDFSNYFITLHTACNGRASPPGFAKIKSPFIEFPSLHFNIIERRKTNK